MRSLGRYIPRAMAVAAIGTAIVAPAAVAAPPTTTEFIAMADAICGAANPKNARLLDKAHDQFDRGHDRKGARILIRNEHFELSYYGDIAKLPETADPAFNEKVDDFLRFQRGQAHDRIRVGRLILKGASNRAINKPDTAAVRKLKKAFRISREIGFTQC
jgi:hypothetical protein